MTWQSAVALYIAFGLGYATGLACALLAMLAWMWRQSWDRKHREADRLRTKVGWK